MVGAVGEPHCDVHHGVTGQHPGFHGLPNPLLNRRDVLTRNLSAHNLVLEDKPLTGLSRLHLEPDVAVLTTTAGLPHEAALGLGLSPDRLPIRPLGLADIRLHLEFSKEAVHDDLEMKLSHP